MVTNDPVPTLRFNTKLASFVELSVHVAVTCVYDPDPDPVIYDVANAKFDGAAGIVSVGGMTTDMMLLNSENPDAFLARTM